MNYRKLGFTQRKPKEPGVYFVSTDGHQTLAGPQRERERWDVADVIFFAGSYTNAHDNYEANAHWRLNTLGGLERAWHPGMWMKGPIRPDAHTSDITGAVGRPVDGMVRSLRTIGRN